MVPTGGHVEEQHPPLAQIEGTGTTFLHMYTPILDLPVLYLPNFFRRPDGESASLKTDLKFSPCVFPGAPGVSEIRNLPKSPVTEAGEKHANFGNTRMGCPEFIIPLCSHEVFYLFIRHNM